MKVYGLRLSMYATKSINGVAEFGREKSLSVHFQRYGTGRERRCQVKGIMSLLVGGRVQIGMKQGLFEDVT